MNEKDHARFMEKWVERDECWKWIGNLNSRGYGRLSMKVDGRWKMMLAHRLSYEHHHGPIPADFVVDHVCGVKACVNPDHLQLLTNAENLAKSRPIRVACPHGHSLTLDNMYADGKCKVCVRRRVNARYHRLRAEARRSTAA